MSKNVETEVFTFDELSDAAKDRARERWRQADSDDLFWSESVLEDFSKICKILGIALDSAKHSNSGKAIWWSGFSSQGDGACFESTYSYKPGALKTIKDYAPQDVELLHIAEKLQQVQRRNFYQLTATMRHRGHYYHSGCMCVDVEDCRDSYRNLGNDEETIIQAMRDLADWLYGRLESEHEYHMVDEQVDESIRVNEYTFTVNGARFG